jgi:hypothetical protein
MINAKYINNINDIEYICNICVDKIENNNIIMLKCNNKHIFCYDCIYDWYKQILKTDSCNYTIKTMCPICRKNGGKLPLKDDIIYNKLIHYNHPLKEYCEQILKNKNKCKNYKITNSKYCNIHKNCNIDKNIINNINVNICGHILKNGINTCKKKSKDGYCYLHKANNNINENNNDILSNIIDNIEKIEI